MHRTTVVPAAAIALLGAVGLTAAPGTAAPAPFAPRTCWSQPTPTWTRQPTPTTTYRTGTTVPTSWRPSTTRPGYGAPTNPSSGTPTSPASPTRPSGPRRPKAAGTDWHGWWGGRRIYWWPQRPPEAAVTGGGLGTGGLMAGPWIQKLQKLADGGAWNDRAAMGEAIAFVHSPLLLGVSLSLMGDANDQVARQGVFATAASTPTAAAGMYQLRGLLENPKLSQHERAAAAMSLGALGDPAVRDLLLRHYQRSHDLAVRIGAQIGLALIPDVEAASLFQRDLQNRRARTVLQTGAAAALGLLARHEKGAQVATDAMVAAAKHADKLNVEARQTLALNLGFARPSALVLARLDALTAEDSDQRTRAMAAIALGRLARAHPDVAERARRSILKRWEKEAPSVKAFLALALGIGKLVQERSRLEHWLHGRGDPLHRSAAALALGLMGDRQAYRAIAQATGDGPPQFRADAAEALGMLGGPEAATKLRTLLHAGSSDAPLRGAAAYGLGFIGQRSDLKALQKALDEDNAAAKSGVILALGAFGGFKARDALLARAEREGLPQARGLAIYAALLAVADRPVDGPAKAVERSPWAREH